MCTSLFSSSRASPASLRDARDRSHGALGVDTRFTRNIVDAQTDPYAAALESLGRRASQRLPRSAHTQHGSPGDSIRAMAAPSVASGYGSLASYGCNLDLTPSAAPTCSALGWPMGPCSRLFLRRRCPDLLLTLLLRRPRRPRVLVLLLESVRRRAGVWSRRARQRLTRSAHTATWVPGR